MSANERPGDERGPAALVQSVDRALAILEILAGRGEVGVTEIAAELYPIIEAVLDELDRWFTTGHGSEARRH